MPYKDKAKFDQYLKDKYKSLLIRWPIAEFETIENIAKSVDMPVTTFIKQAVKHEIERVTQSGPVRDTDTGSETDEGIKKAQA